MRWMEMNVVVAMALMAAQGEGPMGKPSVVRP